MTEDKKGGRGKRNLMRKACQRAGGRWEEIMGSLKAQEKEEIPPVEGRGERLTEPLGAYACSHSTLLPGCAGSLSAPQTGSMLSEGRTGEIQLLKV